MNWKSKWEIIYGKSKNVKVHCIMRESMYIKYSKYSVYQKYSHIPLFFRFHNQNQIFLVV